MPRLSLAPRSEMRVTSALLTQARLLELTGLELRQAVHEELAANPALEEVEASGKACGRCGGLLIDHWCVGCNNGQVATKRGGADADQLLMVAAPRGLTDVLLDDVRASLPTHEHAIARSILGSLDERGFLVDEPRMLARTLGVDVARVRSVLDMVRELGPLGIATRTPRECMLAQIDALPPDTVAPHARAIIASHLEDLAEHRYAAIARRLGIPVAEVASAHSFIRDHLWPYPLQAAQTSREPDQRQFRAPDLVFTIEHDAIRVEVVAAPRVLRLNPLYRDVTQHTEQLKAAEQEHVQIYLDRARTFLRSLQQRAHTLQRVGEALAVRQEAFLRRGVHVLVPLTRLQIAADTGLHESTVCRAVIDKTARVPSGLLCAVADFFVAAQPVQELLRELILAEAEPLSDGQLAELLNARGHTIARRTVAKYREQLGFAPQHARRAMK